MDEVQNLDAEQSNAQELVSPETENQQVAANVERESAQEKNWRELREPKEEWEREAKYQREQNEWLRNQFSKSPAPQQVEAQEDILSEISKQEYVEGEKVARGLKKLEEGFNRKLQEIENSYKKSHQNNLLQDLKKEFHDFDDVVTLENLDLLEQQNPRLAKAIAASNDPYLIAVQSYEYLKSKGIGKPKVTEVERKIEQNKKVFNPHWHLKNGQWLKLSK
jgi:hypothetical protein